MALIVPLRFGDNSAKAVASEVDLARHHIIGCRTSTAIADARRLGAHDHLQESACGVHLTASATVGFVHLVLVFFT